MHTSVGDNIGRGIQMRMILALLVGVVTGGAVSAGVIGAMYWLLK
jgi:hypothetical protein